MILIGASQETHAPFKMLDPIFDLTFSTATHVH